MKKKTFVAALLLLAAGLQTAWAQRVRLFLAGRQPVEYSIFELDSISFDDSQAINTNYEWVDLGLPSGTLWATCNVGASSPEDYGSYFAWGETQSKQTYDWSTYQWCNGTLNTLTKYCTDANYGTVDGKTELEAEDDAATANWDSEWQMPSKAQFEELINSDYTHTEWTTENGVSGYRITSKWNGGSIFLPAGGDCGESDTQTPGSGGSYWTRTLMPQGSIGAYHLSFNPNIIGIHNINFRAVGMNVRPVLVNHAYAYVDLGLPSGTLWATRNVGADSPEDFGGYFAWGETLTKEDYSWGTYLWSKGTDNTLTKYCINRNYGFNGFTDNKTELDLEDDAATVNWGSGWQMPSLEQIKELSNSDQITKEWTTQNGVNGIKITSKQNGNSIFLPATDVQTNGTYWSRSLENTEFPDMAFYFQLVTAEEDYFNQTGDVAWMAGDRSRGRSVRPVRVQESPFEWLVTSIELVKPELILLPGQRASIYYRVLPTTAKNQTLTWESSDEIVATVTANTGIVTAVADGQCIITCRATDGSGVFAECKVTVDSTQGTVNGHDWVDLGLPSGTRWATRNVGADDPGSCGLYFAWGEILPKDEYSWGTYKYCNIADTTMTRYNTTDGLTELISFDDAATANWGSKWQMPSQEQLNELVDATYTTIERTTQDGFYGTLITSKINGKSIFLPAGGNGSEGNSGFYWSRSLSTDDVLNACYLGFITMPNTDIELVSTTKRFCASYVRPVLVETYHNYVDLGLPSGTLWATQDIGATVPEQAGSRFAWGETETKPEYTRENYKFYNGSNYDYTKYNDTDKQKELLAEDDVATVKWGSDWQTPSIAQTEELINDSYTTKEWTTQNDVNGWLITSKQNGNSIFLPSLTTVNGGSYWSRSIFSYGSYYYDKAEKMSFDSNHIYTIEEDRYKGTRIRPVRKK